jgi:hypothetical protein
MYHVELGHQCAENVLCVDVGDLERVASLGLGLPARVLLLLLPLGLVMAFALAHGDAIDVQLSNVLFDPRHLRGRVQRLVAGDEDERLALHVGELHAARREEVRRQLVALHPVAAAAACTHQQQQQKKTPKNIKKGGKKRKWGMHSTAGWRIQPFLKIFSTVQQQSKKRKKKQNRERETHPQGRPC